MSVQVPRQLVEKAVGLERQGRRGRPASPRRSARVITISRQLGSGGRRIAESLSKTLGWPLWDREILDVLASQSHTGCQASMFEALDEKTQGDIESIIYSLLQGVDKHVYLYLLPKAIVTIAQSDAIILGRGAHLLLPDSVKIRVVASHQTRVANLVKFEGLDEKTANEQIKISDHHRHHFVRELSRMIGCSESGQERCVEYDIVINTDRLSVQQASDVILTAVARIFDVEAVRPST